MSLHLLSAILLTLTLLLCGFYAGMTLMCQIGVLPTMRRLDLHAYAQAWRVMDSFMDRAMPPFKLTLLALNLAATISLAMEHRNPLAGLTFLSFLLSLSALVLTIRLQLPLNAQLRMLPANADADTLTSIREQTVHNFAVRMILALLAFSLLSAGTVFLPLR